MDRYNNLFAALNTLSTGREPRLRFLEVGTYNGVRACQLLKYWLSINAAYSVEYHGFDLFEHMTRELSTRELSKSVLPHSKAEVAQRMRAALKPDNARAVLTLHKGNTKETLPAFAGARVPETFGLIFIDGGHSLDTVASDFEHAGRLAGKDTVVLLDDYYENRADFGCHRLVEQGHPHFDFELLGPMDHYEHTGLDIRMVRARYRG